MKRTLGITTIAITLGLLGFAILHVAAQRQAAVVEPFPPRPPIAGPVGPAPAPVVVLGDNAIYVAFDGKLMAFAPRTLEKLAEATYWERPEPPRPPNQ